MTNTASPTWSQVAVASIAAIVLGMASAHGADTDQQVDFRHAPPEWQTAICLPDDPHKSLVDRSGEMLYHFGQGGREFATRVAVEVDGAAVWETQELHAPRVPIVRTRRAADGLEIVEEAFAVTDLRQPDVPTSPLQRVDSGGVNRDWAKPPESIDPALKHIAVHMGGSIQYELVVPVGAARRVALALCEGWWNETGQRVQLLRVEGAEPTTVDAVADLGQNQAGAFWFAAQDANRDGRIEISVDAAPQAADKNTILNGLWVFAANSPPDSAALLSGKLNSTALARMSTSSPGGPARNDVILVRVTNTGVAERTVHPRLIVDTTLPFAFQPAAQRVVINDHETITASLKLTGLPQEQSSRRALELEALTVPAGQSATFFVLYSGGGSIVCEPATVEQALASRTQAVAYWEKAPLPFGRVQVPDAGIQALVDSSIRNIWQAREIKKGLPVFQVGPTCYRGLWIVDGAFLLESAAMVGAGHEARSAITYTLSQQKPSGAFEVLSPKFYKENGIVLWTCVRHAMLTQDKAWLQSVWPQLEQAAGYIQALRKQSLEDDTPLDDGLNPPGEIDGGLSGQATGYKRPEFSNVHWNLLGLHAFIQAAHWLGKADAAALWQKEYDDLYATFRQAAARDVQADEQGHSYVPIFMANEGQELPQRGQWTFCHAVYPGQIFAQDDPLVASTLAMLQATEREGMVYGTGWDATGIWNYFASFYGHAWLWQGNGRKAAQTLYAFANHASPTLLWREEQSLSGEPFKKVGDMPHNWASAEFVRLVIHLLALDRGDELHLLEGLPREWMRPAMVTRLDGVATPFGPLDMTVVTDDQGKTATLTVKPLAANCTAIVVHLPDGATRRVAPQQGGTVTFAVEPVPTANYAPVCEPEVRLSLLRLPPGAVEPTGWLRDWAQAARDGITGHLDQWHPTFADGWKGTPIQAPGAGADGTGWPIEQSAYWLDGALRLGFVLHDKEFIQKIRARLDPVVDGVNKASFGTSFIHWKKGYKPQGFDSWAHSQMGRALVALYEGTGDQRVLDALVKVYADYPGNMGHANFSDVTGLCNLDAMLETYAWSGDRRIFDRALQAINQPNVVQELDAWREGRLTDSHMVITYENLRLPALVYPWSGNSRHLQATKSAWQWLDDHHMLPYGVASGEEFASGVGAFRKTETCDVTAMLLSASWMYRIEGRGDWGDRMERAFFNAGAAPVARDFQTMCYYQSPNRLRADSLPCEQPLAPGPGGIRFSRLGCPSVLCCVGAVNRIVPNYIIHMWMATHDHGLAATLYGPSKVSAWVGPHVSVQLNTTTDYPFGETMRMQVEPEQDVAFPLYLRIPSWCHEPHIAVNGAPVAATPDDKGFVRIARTWSKHDVVELAFPMQPQVVRGYETEFPAANREYFKFEPDSLFQPRRLPYASVLCGPLLFALPIPDTDANTPRRDARWQYALDIDAAASDVVIPVERKPLPAHWDWPMDAPVSLRVPARAIDWQPTDAQALPDKPLTGTASETLRLVPYGCTKFRISMFPVTPRAWTEPVIPPATHGAK
ncbi:MAG: beta-L-arabinofuranosidase domain-containing protein [Pirellulaceae bacterium]